MYIYVYKYMSMKCLGLIINIFLKNARAHTEKKCRWELMLLLCQHVASP